MDILLDLGKFDEYSLEIWYLIGGAVSTHESLVQATVELSDCSKAKAGQARGNLQLNQMSARTT